MAAIRHSEMTSLQRVLYATYRAEHRRQKERELEINQMLYDLGEARRSRDGGQTYLETLHALAVEHGIGENVSEAWPVAPPPEKPQNVRAWPSAE